MTNIATDVTDLIGGTPLVRINRLKKGGAEIVAKVEAFNPVSRAQSLMPPRLRDSSSPEAPLSRQLPGTPAWLWQWLALLADTKS